MKRHTIDEVWKKGEAWKKDKVIRLKLRPYRPTQAEIVAALDALDDGLWRNDWTEDSIRNMRRALIAAHNARGER